jgi:hypothetical protein
VLRASGHRSSPRAASPWRVCPRPDPEQGSKAARRGRSGYRRPAGPRLGKGKRLARHSWSRRSIKWSADDSSRNSRCSGRCAGPIFCCRPGRGPQLGSGRPIPPLVSKIQVATTNAGTRAQGCLTQTFWRSRPRVVRVLKRIAADLDTLSLVPNDPHADKESNHRCSPTPYLCWNLTEV